MNQPDESLAWAPIGRELLGAIVVERGKQLTDESYFHNLGFRLREMALNADPAGLESASQMLMECGALGAPLIAEQAGSMLIWENHVIRSKLADLGVPGPLLDEPPVEQLNQEAEYAIAGVTLDMWAMELAGAMRNWD